MKANRDTMSPTPDNAVSGVKGPLEKGGVEFKEGGEFIIPTKEKFMDYFLETTRLLKVLDSVITSNRNL